MTVGPSLRRGALRALAAASLLGGFSALGDWIWARFIPDGAVVPGIVHGVLIFALLALALGAFSGRRRALPRLMAALPALGLLIAAAFYPLAYLVGYLGALLATWVAMWMGLALAQRWAVARGESLRRAAVRGGLAAIGSGLAFWSISGIWTDPSPEPDYWLRWVQWAYAFLPGFLALLLGRPEEGDGS